MNSSPPFNRALLLAEALLSLAMGGYTTEDIRRMAWHRFQLPISVGYVVVGAVPGVLLLAFGISASNRLLARWENRVHLIAWAGIIVSLSAMTAAWGNYELEENRRNSLLRDSESAGASANRK